MYTIGEFSKIGKVTTKMLRHYDSIGLLPPKMINPDNSYRYYSHNQVRDILLINKLKQYNFSLKEIGELLKHEDIETYIEGYSNKIKEIQSKINDYSSVLVTMQKELDNLMKGVPIMKKREFNISIDKQPDLIVVSKRTVVSLNDIGNIIGQCIERVYQNGLSQTGPIMIKYYNEDFNPDQTDLEVRVPVNKELKGVTSKHTGYLCAHTRFVGPYSELGNAYAALNDYITENNYRPCSAPYDIYLTSPGPGIDPTEAITEVYFPIEK